MKFAIRTILPFAAALLVLSACNKDEDPEPSTPSTPGLQIPANYSSPDYDANTTAEYGVRAQLAALGSYMKQPESANATILEEAQMNSIFTAGTP